jgi:hypothetical protein
MAARNIIKIAERIVRFWGSPIPDSAALMIKHVLQFPESNAPKSRL